MSEHQDLAYTRIAHMAQVAILLLLLTFTVGVFVGIAQVDLSKIPRDTLSSVVRFVLHLS